MIPPDETWRCCGIQGGTGYMKTGCWGVRFFPAGPRAIALGSVGATSLVLFEDPLLKKLIGGRKGQVCHRIVRNIRIRGGMHFFA